MASFGIVSFTTLLSLRLAGLAAGQALSSIPVVPVSVVHRPREIARDTSDEAVVIVHGLSVLEPTDRPLQSAYVGLGPPGTDVRYHPARTADTDTAGTAVFSRLAVDSVDVVVLRVGYRAVRFSLGLARQCHQMIQIYVAQYGEIDGEVGGPPSPRPRVVLTTCAPA